MIPTADPRHLARLLLQFALCQTAWLACVLGAARGQPMFGAMAAFGFIAVQLWISQERTVDVLLVLLCMLVGLAWDTMLLHAGLVVYSSPGPLSWLAPIWIVALWALFAVLLREPLAWLHDRPWLACGLGAVSGCGSYLGAVRLGAGSLPNPPLAAAVLTVGWAVITPCLLMATRWLTRRSGQRRQVRL